MSQRILRILAAIVLLFAFWPVLRFGGLTVFDCTAPVVAIAIACFGGKEKNVSYAAFGWPSLGILLFSVAGIFSMAFSSDTTDHVEKVVKVLLALSMMLCFAFVLPRKKIFSIVEVLALLALSGAIHSVVCILQGRFGIFTGLIPVASGGLEEWNRMTGLAEHPIEAGYISAFSAVIAVGLVIHTRKWFLCLLIIAIDLYSLKYSASLTATFAIVTGIGIVCLFARAYSILMVFASMIGIALIVTLSSGDMGDKLASRLDTLMHSQGNYGTLKTREDQWSKTIKGIDLGTVMFGNGYSASDLPNGIEIHNGFLAAIFHFGILGLLSQFCLIWFFVSRLFGDSPRSLRGILLGCIVIFASGYMTGPPLSRRSVWVPMFLIAAYLPQRRTNIHQIGPIYKNDQTNKLGNNVTKS
jgi:hypothetical protein